MEARWLSVRTAAIYMDCRPCTLRAWINNGLPCVRIRHRNSTGVGKHICTIRIDRLALEKWMESRSR